jgi:hypothetical protein
LSFPLNSILIKILNKSHLAQDKKSPINFFMRLDVMKNPGLHYLITRDLSLKRGSTSAGSFGIGIVEGET